MRTSSTLFVILCLGPQLSAQNWCAPGAEWLFNFHSQGATGVRRAWYSGDTLVGGLPCQRIDQTIIAYEPVFPFGTPFIVQDEPIITHGQDDLIRVWDQLNNEFDTLAWFGAVPGDRWNVPQYEGPGQFDVLDTGTRVIAGIPLHYLVVEEEVVMGMPDTLFERIGFEYFYVRPAETLLIDFVTSGLICYHDDLIGQFDGWSQWHPCDFTLSLEEWDAPNAQPSPNPGIDHFTLSLSSGPHTITLLDVTGSIVLQERTSDGCTRIGTAQLPSGIYLVRIDEGTEPMRWVKQ